MDKINNQSDFTLFEENIFPSDSVVPFRFTYSTTDGRWNYVVSFINDVFTNCRLSNDKKSVYSFFNSPNLGEGRLIAEREFLIPDENFKDGINNLVTKNYLDILITPIGTQDKATVTTTIPYYYKGLSAYEISVNNGYVGSESEWVDYISSKAVSLDQSIAATSAANNAATAASSATIAANNAASSATTAATAATSSATAASSATIAANNAASSATTAATAATSSATAASSASIAANNAASSATTAASNATTAASNVTAATSEATAAASSANTAAANAVTETNNAKNATQAAKNAATAADGATSNTVTATSAANTATSNTNAAILSANTATSNASTATSAANTATSNANTATSNANTATSNAIAATTITSTATSAANTATSNANTAASAIQATNVEMNNLITTLKSTLVIWDNDSVPGITFYGYNTVTEGELKIKKVNGNDNTTKVAIGAWCDRLTLVYVTEVISNV